MIDDLELSESSLFKSVFSIVIIYSVILLPIAMFFAMFTVSDESWYIDFIGTTAFAFILGWILSKITKRFNLTRKQRVIFFLSMFVVTTHVYMSAYLTGFMFLTKNGSFESFLVEPLLYIRQYLFSVVNPIHYIINLVSVLKFIATFDDAYMYFLPFFLNPLVICLGFIGATEKQFPGMYLMKQFRIDEA